MPSALLFTQSETDAEIIRKGLGSQFRVRSVVARPDQPLPAAAIQSLKADVIFVDIRMIRSAAPPGGCQGWLKPWQALDPVPEMVVLTPKELIRDTIQCIKAGAGDYLTLPTFAHDVRLVAATLDRTLKRRKELLELRRQVQQAGVTGVLKTRNPQMETVLAKLEAVAPTRTNVLLSGETGTGKGLLARVIHNASERNGAPFMAVHCGAIPDTLLESELFGHEKGAFTGAVRRKMGKFEIARTGTIFLDEVDTLTPPAQIKLLQVLQERTFTRVGGEHEISADVRVIAAANTDLSRLSQTGDFRQDLYYRLNVFPIHLPALRERPEDIPLFTQFFLERLNGERRKRIAGVEPDAMQALRGYPWPGNIRELENLIERAYILESGPLLSLASLPAELAAAGSGSLLSPALADLTLAQARQRAVEGFERQYLNELLLRHQGRINRSAAQAGVSTRQLHKLMARHAIRKEDYKT
jgi:DNA-binding NtrC family response regulator